MDIELTKKRNIFLIRLVVIIIVSYLLVFGRTKESLLIWTYVYLLVYLTTNLLILHVPEKFFINKSIFYVLVFFDSCMVALGILLSGRAGTEFYLLYFVIIGLAAMSTGLKYLMMNTTVFALLYGWLLYQKGMFSGDMAVSYGLRLPFMVIMALFFGYIVDAILRDSDRSLKESEEKYRSLVESTDDAVYMVDGECRYLSANNKLLKELALSEAEISGKSFGDFHLPEETKRFAKRVKKVCETKRAVRYETFDSGLRKWFLLTLSPVKDPSERTVKAVSVISKDITDRIHTERKLESAYAKLKKSQEQLIQSAKMSAIGQLASGIAHQIRNPLGIIVMGVEFLSDVVPEKDAMLNECMDKIEEAAKRTNRIISDFFQFSRTSEFELKAVDLCELLDEAITLMDHRFIVNNIQIHKDYPELSIEVTADKNTLQQVFVNLFNNALDAMPEGGKVRVGIFREQVNEHGNRSNERRSYRGRTNGNMTVVEIEDSGKGIPEDVLPKIFEPFFTTKLPGQGTGLGLSTVQAIVQRHEGSVDVRSVVEQGTKFSVRLHSAPNATVGGPR